MADREDILVQKISLVQDGVSGPTFDRAFLKEFTFIETLDVSGPRLIFVMDDYYRIIRDQLGVKEHSTLEIVLSDRFQQDGFDNTLRFVVQTMPIDDRWITFNCLEATVARLKIPARKEMLFTKKSIASILQKLAPGVHCDVGNFPTLNDYHLLPGMRPTKLLRQMAQEHGAVCFYRRGTLVFRKLKELYAAAPALTYHHNDARQKNKIIVYSKPNSTALLEDRVDRSYFGWDMVDGVVRSGGSATAPPEFASAGENSLDNLALIPKPVIKFMTAGSGHLVPGATMGMVWNTERPDMPVDESLPGKAVIGEAAHAWRPQSYFCQVRGVRP